MDILGAAESRLQSAVDNNAFIINVLVKDQSKTNALQELLNAVKQYQSAAAQLEIIRSLKSQVQYNSQDSKTTEQQ